jgi:hypothetical protein
MGKERNTDKGRWPNLSWNLVTKLQDKETEDGKREGEMQR